ncbi:hypothetical protein J9174_08960 [Macrococcoides canis]|uniref:hypothetical protein n=1 Tax=Macrococcoides canis TaxID=1855823 RepID=UPI001AEC64EE|nr:hypothetical protein [Macrococcus canis]QTQ07553.1 hypothetical protein J9174_08960 [Macrococcus canis]
MMDLKFEKKLNNRTEVTSAISTVAYQIENTKYNKVSNDEIYYQVEKNIGKNKFPKNLTFIDAYLDEANGMSGCAFLDENTGKVIIGFAGTNFDTSKVHGYKDVIADANIGFDVISASHRYYESTHEFIEKIRQDYTISSFTGFVEKI